MAPDVYCEVYVVVSKRPCRVAVLRAVYPAGGATSKVPRAGDGVVAADAGMGPKARMAIARAQSACFTVR
jgi:hypothetical protein